MSTQVISLLKEFFWHFSIASEQDEDKGLTLVCLIVCCRCLLTKRKLLFLLLSKRISFRTGGLITAVIGIVMMPWKLLSDFGTYIFGWLVGYSSFLGPIAGVLIADYFIVRKKSLNVKELYLRGGAYEYSKGFNSRAMIALVSGVAIALVGLFVDELRILYDYAWFIGFTIAFFSYVVLMKTTQSSRSQENSEDDTNTPNSSRS
jgi:cytosine/uracil/thiamine/allantoin permease